MRFLLFLTALTLLAACASMAQDEAAPDSLMAAAADSMASADSAAVAGEVIIDDDGEQIYPMSPERHEKLVSYARFNSIWRFVGFLIGIVIPSIFLFTGWSAKFRDWSKKAPIKFFALWVFLAIYLIADFIFELPFSVYRGFVVESDYGFMNQTFGAWFWDSVKSLGVGIIFMIIPIWFLYWLLNATKKWWLWFTAGMIPFMLLTVVVVPIWVMPLFNEYGPLKDKALEAEILSLANKVGIEGADVFEVDASKQSDKINAYVTGLFGTKRIVLYDTLIKGFTNDEIMFVMAHEMGHYVKHHVWQGLGLAIVVIGFLLWAASRLLPITISRFKDRFRFDHLGDYASLPLVMIFLTVGGFVLGPVTNTFSRSLERTADRYGMDMSGVDSETAARTFDKLSVFNLSDPDPNPIIEFWFYDHPALNKRIEFVRNYHPQGH